MSNQVIVSSTQQHVRFQSINYVDFDKLVAYCTQQKYQYATEVPKKDRLFEVVIRKLLSDTLTKDIFDDIIHLEFPVTEVSQMYGRDKDSREKIPHPLFLALSQSAPTITRSITLNIY